MTKNTGKEFESLARIDGLRILEVTQNKKLVCD
jgi:hypothetical protein